MTQYAKLRVKFPRGLTVEQLEESLLRLACECEVTGIHLSVEGVPVPLEFVPKKRERE